MSNIISPTSLLLSATGTLAFKNCGLSDEVSTFTAPEMLQGCASSTKPAIERVSACILTPVLVACVKVHYKPDKTLEHISSLFVFLPPIKSGLYLGLYFSLGYNI